MPILFICLLAYLWSATGIAGVPWAPLFANDDHHQAVYQNDGDRRAVVLSHQFSHEHGDDESAHVAEEHHHHDHVFELPSPPDSSLATHWKDVEQGKLIAIAGPQTYQLRPASFVEGRRQTAQPPPLSRSSGTALKQITVLLL